MAKKKARAAVSFVRKVSKRKTCSQSYGVVEGAASDLWEVLKEDMAPAVGGFVGTRLISRIARVQVSKRLPALGKHAGPLAGALSLLLIWALTSKLKSLHRYKAPAMIGATLALLATIVRTYMPNLAWLFDESATVAALPATSGAPKATGSNEEDMVSLPPMREQKPKSEEDQIAEALSVDPEYADILQGNFAPTAN